MRAAVLDVSCPPCFYTKQRVSHPVGMNWLNSAQLTGSTQRWRGYAPETFVEDLEAALNVGAVGVDGERMLPSKQIKVEFFFETN